ncbi:MAG TPA: type 1 glutamine amidotransferase [Mycobacteriales bacterium]|nr:type 1 glutamine amidotransferase [Mycobacteriales bacterium]
MARVHVVQHGPSDGLGLLADWLPAFGVDVHPTHPYLGNRVPPSVEGDALIVLGGAMGAYDDDVAPWLPSVRELLASAVDDGVPTIGICLGAQLLAVAVGGTVEHGRNGPEIGLGEVVVPSGDELLDAGIMPVLQWHHDAVSALPDGVEVVAYNDRYPVQAFRVGEVAWGLQFHIEATAEIFRSWAVEEGEDLSIADPVAFAADRLAEVGEKIARRFAAIITG